MFAPLNTHARLRCRLERRPAPLATRRQALTRALALAGGVGLAWLAAAPVASVAASAATPPAARDAMVRLDALYIPALSLTSAAQADAKAGARAQAAVARLQQAWPALRAALQAAPPSPQAAMPWQQALQQAGQQLARAGHSTAAGQWKQAHEDLEPVRERLMQVRVAAGFDYFVDRLTAYHEPMEALALAGLNTTPAALTAERRAELEHHFAEAAARWRAVEQATVDAAAYRLSAARASQLRQALADEAQALSRLSAALRGADNAALLAAARAIKPPFARAFTAFGLAEGETLQEM